MTAITELQMLVRVREDAHSMTMTAPMCGTLVVVRQPGEDDYISGCWERPDHEGPHVIIIPPASMRPEGTSP